MSTSDENGAPEDDSVEEAPFGFRDWPFFWLARTQGLYMREMEKELRKIGLDRPRWRVLMTLHEEQRLSISDIAEFAISKLPTMMRIIQRMQSDGLVECRPRSSDGRVTEVTLTDAGRAAGDRAWIAANRIYKRAFLKIPKSRQYALNRILQDIEANLSQ